MANPNPPIVNPDLLAIWQALVSASGGSVIGNQDYGDPAVALRTASEIGNSTGAASWGSGLADGQTVRTVEASNSDLTQNTLSIADRLVSGGFSAANLLYTIQNTWLAVNLPNLISATQDITGNTDVNSFTSGLAAVSQNLYSVTAGKILYLKILQVSIIGTNCEFTFTDGLGGPTICKYFAGNSTPNPILFNYPHKLSTGLYYNYLSGSPTNISVSAHGYEKV